MQSMQSYNLSIPLNRTHLLMNENQIISPIDGSIISIEDFYNIEKTPL